MHCHCCCCPLPGEPQAPAPTAGKGFKLLGSNRLHSAGVEVHRVTKLLVLHRTLRLSSLVCVVVGALDTCESGPPTWASCFAFFVASCAFSALQETITSVLLECTILVITDYQYEHKRTYMLQATTPTEPVVCDTSSAAATSSQG